MSSLSWSESAKGLFRDRERFDAMHLRWSGIADVPADLAPVGDVAAARRLLSLPGARRLPVGVIGPRDASPVEYAQAETVGRVLTEAGFPIICGGRSGAMEAVCKGAAAAGGSPIGLLPDDDWRKANDYVALPMATGLGEARNALIACASFALVAVGGGYGTLSEIALGLRLGRLVISMPPSFEVDGALRIGDPEEVVRVVARRFLALDGA